MEPAASRLDQGARLERDLTHDSLCFGADDGSLDRHDCSYGGKVRLPIFFTHLDRVDRLRRHHLPGFGIIHGLELENFDPDDAADDRQHDDDAEDGPEEILRPLPWSILCYALKRFYFFHGVISLPMTTIV